MPVRGNKCSDPGQAVGSPVAGISNQNSEPHPRRCPRRSGRRAPPAAFSRWPVPSRIPHSPSHSPARTARRPGSDPLPGSQGQCPRWRSGRSLRPPPRPPGPRRVEARTSARYRSGCRAAGRSGRDPHLRWKTCGRRTRIQFRPIQPCRFSCRGDKSAANPDSVPLKGGTRLVWHVAMGRNWRLVRRPRSWDSRSARYKQEPSPIEQPERADLHDVVQVVVVEARVG